MTNEPRETLRQEWISLQSSYQQTENQTLVIKLGAVALCFVALIADLNAIATALLLLLLWLQEAIWKTFQNRTEQRLLAVEQAWSAAAPAASLQFYSHWQDSRPGIAGLITEYLANAFRPTVAYPYILLLPVGFIVPFLPFG